MNPLAIRLGRRSAAALLIAGVLFNKWTLELLVASDGSITSPLTVAAIVVVQGALLLAGVLLLRRRSVSIEIPVATIAVSTLVAFAMAEAALRLFPEFRPVARAFVGDHPNHPSRNFVPDSLTGWRMLSQHTFQWRFDGEVTTYRSNSDGMRESSEFAERGRAPRIVFIGDSFVFGTGIEQDHTVDAQLEDSLGHRIDAPNLAMPGFGLDQMWMSLRHQALPLAPAFVVVAFIDDDWDRSLVAYRAVERMNKPTFIREGDTLRRRTPADRPGSFARFVESHSATWRLLQTSSRALAFRVPRGEWWELNSAIIEAMWTDASARGVPILFVRLPRKGMWRPFPALQAHMARLGAPYLDLADPSRQRADVHLVTDDHLSKLGHGWVAGEILAWLRAKPLAGLAPALSGR